MKLTIDANIWLAATRASEVHHVQAKVFLSQIRGLATVICPSLVLTECSSAAARSMKSEQAGLMMIEVLIAFPNIRFIELSEARATEAARIGSAIRLRGAGRCGVRTGRP